MLNWLLPIIDSTPHKNFIDVCGGSGVVIMNKKTSKAEVYNDIYGDVVRFFRTLRLQPDELIEALELTPYSREEFVIALGKEEVSDLEAARRFFVKARQVTLGLVSTASPGRWCYSMQSRKNKSLVVSRWLGAIENLSKVAARFREIQIENLDALDLINRYDSIDSLFYIDPPYPMELRSGGKAYKYEWTTAKHNELLEKCLTISGKIILSSYANDKYDKILEGWYRTEGKPKSCATTRRYNGTDRIEVLWTNFIPVSKIKEPSSV